MARAWLHSLLCTRRASAASAFLEVDMVRQSFLTWQQAQQHDTSRAALVLETPFPGVKLPSDTLGRENRSRITAMLKDDL